MKLKKVKFIAVRLQPTDHELIKDGFSQIEAAIILKAISLQNVVNIICSLGNLAIFGVITQIAIYLSYGF